MTTPRHETLSRLASILDIAKMAKKNEADFRARWSSPEHWTHVTLNADTILWLVDLASDGVKASGTLLLPTEARS